MYGKYTISIMTSSIQSLMLHSGNLEASQRLEMLATKSCQFQLNCLAILISTPSALRISLPQRKLRFTSNVMMRRTCSLGSSIILGIVTLIV
jgi:hypothetical protein